MSKATEPDGRRLKRRWTLMAGTLAATAALIGSTTPAHAALTKDQQLELLRTIDQRQRSFGDYRADAYLETREKGKDPIVYNALVFRRAADERFMILFMKPKSSQGQGYLRVDRNIWFYDPSVGKWERRTERERIGGTHSRRSDFDSSSLTEEYDPEDNGEEQLGVHTAHVLTLRGKPNRELAFPVIKMWIDNKTKNVLKRQEFALSGKLLRTSYYLRWKKVFSEAKKDDVWYAEEVRFYDEIEKDSSTVLLIQSIELKPLETNLFTKAWLEARSR